VIAVTLGLVLFLEAMLRVFWPQTLRGTPLRGAHFSQRDAVLGMSYLPGSVWRFTSPEYTATYAINRDGFRDDLAWAPRKAEGTTRILLLGDSFTFGQGVDLSETWPVLAERELEGLAIDLLNAGIQGMDTRSQLTLLRRLVQRYDVDGVVLGFLINDLYTNLRRPSQGAVGELQVGKSPREPPTVFRTLDQTRSLHLLTLARRIVQSIDAGYIALYLAAPERGEYLRPPLSGRPLRQLQITEELLREMAAFCDSLGKPFAVISLPQQFQVLYQRSGRRDESVDASYYDRHFAQVAKSSGFAWVPALPAVVAAPEASGDLFYPLDGHFTPRGTAAVARVVARHLIPGLLRRLDR
jgi:lysophospholipase L1-like esterase